MSLIMALQIVWVTQWFSLKDIMADIRCTQYAVPDQVCNIIFIESVLP